MTPWAKPLHLLSRGIAVLFALPFLGCHAPSSTPRGAAPGSRTASMPQAQPVRVGGSLNLVVCLDGTSNSPMGNYALPDLGGGATTNVFRLFQNLDGQNTPATAPTSLNQEKVARNAAGAVEQIAFYQAGIATSANGQVNTMERDFGLGLTTRIARGYAFLARNYEPGDRIYLLGFSRGAYAARALAGLIDREGLADPHKVDLSDPVHAERVAQALWLQHQRKLQASFSGRLQALAEDLPAIFDQAPDPRDLVPAPIQGIAVWDTVGAMGIPKYGADGERIDTFDFADPVLPPAVGWGLHAVSVDERREDFTPSLWHPDPRVTQVLFPGTHGDVGGGFTPAASHGSLADLSLAWMSRELSRRGLRFAPAPAYVAAPQPLGPAHDKSLGSKRPQGPRKFPTCLLLHASVLERLQGGPVLADPSLAPAPYAPPSLEGTYLDHGRVRPGVTVVR